MKQQQTACILMHFQEQKERVDWNLSFWNLICKVFMKFLYFNDEKFEIFSLFFGAF